jgi:hypothetical protein
MLIESYLTSIPPFVRNFVFYPRIFFSSYIYTTNRNAHAALALMLVASSTAHISTCRPIT